MHRFGLKSRLCVKLWNNCIKLYTINYFKGSYNIILNQCFYANFKMRNKYGIFAKCVKKYGIFVRKKIWIFFILIIFILIINYCYLINYYFYFLNLTKNGIKKLRNLSFYAKLDKKFTQFIPKIVHFY